MSIYYGDIPVGGGSGRTEWDKIEGKPFDTNTFINTTVVSTNVITLSNHYVSGQKFGVLLNGYNYDIFEPKLVNNMYSVEFNGSTYNFESVSECYGRDGEYILKYNYLGNPVIMQEFGFNLDDSIGTDNNMPFCVIEEASYNEDRNNKLTGLMLYIVVADDAMEEASVGVNMVCQQFGKLYQECLPDHTHSIGELPVVVSTEPIFEGDYLKSGTFYFVYEE